MDTEKYKFTGVRLSSLDLTYGCIYDVCKNGDYHYILDDWAKNMYTSIDDMLEKLCGNGIIIYNETLYCNFKKVDDNK